MTSFYPDQTPPLLITDKSTMMADLKKEEFGESIVFFFPILLHSLKRMNFEVYQSSTREL